MYHRINSSFDEVSFRNSYLDHHERKLVYDEFYSWKQKHFENIEDVVINEGFSAAGQTRFLVTFPDYEFVSGHIVPHLKPKTVCKDDEHEEHDGDGNGDQNNDNDDDDDDWSTWESTT